MTNRTELLTPTWEEPKNEGNIREIRAKSEGKKSSFLITLLKHLEPAMPKVHPMLDYSIT